MEFIDAVRRWVLPEREKSALRQCFYDVGVKLKSTYRRENTLPWYLLLGFPQSGKSSLLKYESESTWRKIGSHRESDSGHDCDWWLADQAVVVDIAGRYLQPDENRSDSQWQRFAELLQRNRKPQAVNAVIVVVSAAELQDVEEENLRQRAGLLKQRLHDLQSSSQARIPFYLVVSKCDLLTGFSDYFASIPSEERHQVWGVALTPEAGAEDIMSKLAALQKTLHALLPQRLQSERDAHRRRDMVAFPSQLQRLVSRLSPFTNMLAPHSESANVPLLRGIYLTAAAAQSCRHFSDHLFRDVFFADAMPKHPAQGSQRTSAVLHRLSTAAIVTVTILLLTCWVTAFIFQQRDITAARKLLSRYEHAHPVDAMEGHLTLTEADKAIAMLERAMAQGPRNTRRVAMLGMRDTRLNEAIQSSYDAALEQQWLPALSENLRRRLLSHNDDFDEQFSALKAWLMLVEPAHRDMGYLQHWISNSNTVDQAQRDLINARLQQLYKRKPSFALPIDNKAAILPIQEKLLAVSMPDRIYEQWKANYSGQVLALKPQLGSNVDEVFSARENFTWNIPLLYTADVFHTLSFDEDMPELKQLERDWWVLGDAALPLDSRQRKNIVQALRERYSRDYASTWKNIFNALSLKRANDSTSLLAQLRTLSDTETSPLAALLRISGEHTRLLEGRFPAVAISQEKTAALTATLAELRNWLNTIYHADDIGGAALQTTSAGNGVLSPPRKTLAFANELPSPVADWVATLARNASNSISKTASGSLETAWRQQVADFCRANIGDRYPFRRDAAQTVNYGDFVDYFRVGGIEDSFVRSKLSDAIDHHSWTSRSGATIQLSTQTLRMLQQAQKIRSAFFNGQQAGFSYRITPARMSENLQRFEISTGSTHFEYSHGPRLATQFDWPQPDDILETRFTSLSDSKVTRSYTGVWALFRLLDAATQIQRDDADTTRWVLREGRHDMEFMLSTPLNRELLSDYSCVTQLGRTVSQIAR